MEMKFKRVQNRKDIRTRSKLPATDAYKRNRPFLFQYVKDCRTRANTPHTISISGHRCEKSRKNILYIYTYCVLDKMITITIRITNIYARVRCCGSLFYKTRNDKSFCVPSFRFLSFFTQMLCCAVLYSM